LARKLHRQHRGDFSIARHRRAAWVPARFDGNPMNQFRDPDSEAAHAAIAPHRVVAALSAIADLHQ
jgi:hypothetical protein